MPDSYHLWLKALHVIAVIFWMAGLYMMPRLFVYHHPAPPGSQMSETMKAAERRLMRIILIPGAVASWALGVLLVLSLPGSPYEVFGLGWLQAKVLLVVVLTGFQVAFGAWVQAFARDERPRSERFFRLINEVPPLLTIAIVIVVIVKPL